MKITYFLISDTALSKMIKKGIQKSSHKTKDKMVCLGKAVEKSISKKRYSHLQRNIF